MSEATEKTQDSFEAINGKKEEPKSTKSAATPKLKEIAKNNTDVNASNNLMKDAKPITSEDSDILAAVIESRKKIQYGHDYTVTQQEMEQPDDFPRWSRCLFGPQVGEHSLAFYAKPRKIRESEYKGGFGFGWIDSKRVREALSKGWLLVNRMSPFEVPRTEISSMGAVEKVKHGIRQVLLFRDWDSFKNIYGDPYEGLYYDREGALRGETKSSGRGMFEKASQDRMRDPADEAVDGIKGVSRLNPEDAKAPESARTQGAFNVYDDSTNTWVEGNEDMLREF